MSKYVQDDSYPDPKQLKAFAQEPMPFGTVEDIHPGKHGYLVGNHDNVFYRYRPSYIRVTPDTAPDSAYEAGERDGCDLDHDYCYREADDLSVEEDFITATGIAVERIPESDAMFEAFWILDEIQIVVPDDS